MSDDTNCQNLMNLSVTQESAIALILSGKNDVEISNELHIHRMTVARWREHHPAFKCELTRRRSEIFAAAAERLRSLASKAVGVLEAELDGPNKLIAAQGILKNVGLEKLAVPELKPDDVDGYLHKLVYARIDAIKAAREIGMSSEQRMQIRIQRTAEDEREIMQQAVKYVTSEIVWKLTGKPQVDSPSQSQISKAI